MSEAFRGIEVAIQSLLAVGEEVKGKMRNPDLEHKMEFPLAEIRKFFSSYLHFSLSLSLSHISFLSRCLDELAVISDSLQRSHKFDSRVRDKLLTTGQRMLMATVRTLKFADIYDCLRVIKIIKQAVDSCHFFGEQVCFSFLSLSFFFSLKV